MIPAIVLAGGLGTRLRAVTGDTPKPLMPVGERPFIEYILDMLVEARVPTICLATCYQSEAFQRRFGSAYRGIPLSYSVEREPLGTGGAILNCLKKSQLRTVLVLNGDTLFRIDLGELIRAHISVGSLVTIALRGIDDASRYGAVTLGPDKRIVAFDEKGSGRAGLINGGIYVLDRSALERPDLREKFSLERDVLQQHVGVLRPLGVVNDGYFVDIGIPADFERARRDMGHAP